MSLKRFYGLRRSLRMKRAMIQYYRDINNNRDRSGVMEQWIGWTEWREWLQALTVRWEECIQKSGKCGWWMNQNLSFRGSGRRSGMFLPATFMHKAPNTYLYYLFAVRSLRCQPLVFFLCLAIWNMKTTSNDSRWPSNWVPLLVALKILDRLPKLRQYHATVTTTYFPPTWFANHVTHIPIRLA